VVGRRLSGSKWPVDAESAHCRSTSTQQTAISIFSRICYCVTAVSE